MKRFCIILVSVIFTLMLTAQEYSTKVINGKSYYEYIVAPGDGLFSIARRFGITQAEMHAANENLTTDIRVGDVILIPIREQRQRENHNNVKAYHIVEPKQTLFAISRLYNVPLDSIERLNSYAALHGIHPGDTIILALTTSTYNIEQTEIRSNKPIVIVNPNDGIPATHTVKPKETLFSISKLYNIPIHDILDLNPGLENGLKAGSVIRLKAENEVVAVESTPKEEPKPVVEEVKEPVTTLVEDNNIKEEATQTVTPIELSRQIAPFGGLEFPTDRPLRIAYLLPLNASKKDKNTIFAEFYKGSLLAMQKAKNEGISAEIFIYDTEKNASKIDSLLNCEEFQQIDIIVGPAYSEHLEQVISYARKKDIICVVPFSNKVPQSCYYPKLFQFNPPQELIISKVLYDVFEPRHLNYVFCNFRSEGVKAHNFSKLFKSILDENSVRYTNVHANETNLDSLINSIGQDSTIFILSTTQAAQAAPIVDKLVQANNKYIELWGFQEWGESLLNRYPKTYFYSLFNGQTDRGYSAAYQQYFGENIHSSWTQYDLIGYDLTTWILYSFSIGTDSNLHINNVNNNLFIQTIPHFEFNQERYVNNTYSLFFWNGSVQNRLK